jgi:pilus assembly protein CpaF
MVLMAGIELPVQAIREQVTSGVNLIVHLVRLLDGSRRITQISEITGREGNVISMHDLFLFQHHGFDAQGRVLGDLLPTGLRPHFMDRLAQFGQELPPETFIATPASAS